MAKFQSMQCNRSLFNSNVTSNFLTYLCCHNNNALISFKNSNLAILVNHSSICVVKHHSDSVNLWGSYIADTIVSCM